VQWQDETKRFSRIQYSTAAHRLQSLYNDFIISTSPGVSISYSVSVSPFDRICYIAPQKQGYVNFGFFFGAALPDPEHLLVGEGKRMRHVKVRSVEEARNPALEKLIAMMWKELELRKA